MAARYSSFVLQCQGDNKSGFIEHNKYHSDISQMDAGLIGRWGKGRRAHDCDPTRRKGTPRGIW